MGGDVVWGEREPGAACALGEEGEMVLDPSLSPDWLCLPNEEGLPAALRGARVRVRCSAWLPWCPNPQATSAADRWLEQRTRWHLLELPGRYAVVEAVGTGWLVLEIGEEQQALLLELADTHRGSP